MVDALTQGELLKELERLPLALQRKVVDFARVLSRSTAVGTPGEQLLRFAGVVPPEEAQAMRIAVEEGCERQFAFPAEA
jgi:hypothetical protein